MNCLTQICDSSTFHRVLPYPYQQLIMEDNYERTFTFWYSIYRDFIKCMY